MKTYSLPDTAFGPIKKKIIINGIGFYVLIATIVTYLSLREDGFQHLGILWFVVPASAAASIIGTLRGVRIQKDAWLSYRLELNESTVVRRQANVPDVRLSRSDVTKVTQFKGGGLRIDSSDRHSFIVVPNCIEGFDEIRTTLAQWQTISAAAGSPRAAYAVLLILWMGIFLAALFSTSREIVIPSAIISLILLAWSGISILSTKQFDARIQKTAWLIIFPFFMLCVKLYLSIKS